MENFIDVVMYSQHQKSCCHLFKCMWMCPAYSHVLHSVCLLYHHMQFMSVTTALSFAFYGEQGGSKMLTKEQISAIASLKLGGKSNREIAVINSIALQIMQHWTKKNREGGDEGLPLHKKRSVRPCISSKRTNEDSPRSSGQRTMNNCKGTREDVPITSPKRLHPNSTMVPLWQPWLPTLHPRRKPLLKKQ